MTICISPSFPSSRQSQKILAICGWEAASASQHKDDDTEHYTGSMVFFTDDLGSGLARLFRQLDSMPTKRIWTWDCLEGDRYDGYQVNFDKQQSRVVGETISDDKFDKFSLVSFTHRVLRRVMDSDAPLNAIGDRRVPEFAAKLRRVAPLSEWMIFPPLMN